MFLIKTRIELIIKPLYTDNRTNRNLWLDLVLIIQNSNNISRKILKNTARILYFKESNYQNMVNVSSISKWEYSKALDARPTKRRYANTTAKLAIDPALIGSMRKGMSPITTTDCVASKCYL